MRLDDPEQRILALANGDPVGRALKMQLEVGEFFGAEDLVPIGNAHAMAEIESMGEAALGWVEEMADAGASFRVPTTINARSFDPEQWQALGQDPSHVEKEQRLSRALQRMGAVLADTCINYQTLSQPRLGEHVAWGDTGTVIYANAVMGARTNYEGGPSAIAAGITGRTPRYGYHLDQQRLATVRVNVCDQPRQKSDWGALGAIVGRGLNDYWLVPALTGIETSPSADDIKQLGACLASYGSLAMFHLVGHTPEAADVEQAFGHRPPARTLDVEPGTLRRFYESFAPTERVDLLAFTAPQLSVLELRDLARRFAGKRVHQGTKLMATTNYQNRALAERLGYVEAIESAGGMVLAGPCFYIMTPRELAEKHGWRTILTDSAKLANIIEGYGYQPIFRPTDVCVEAAVTGRLPW